MVHAEELNDDDAPENTLELFTEYEEVVKMIDNLHQVHDKGFEKAREKFSEVLSKYQEQPHLLDPHIPRLIEILLAITRNESSPDGLVNAGFKYLYQICKVRTFKTFVKFMPHELSDIDFVLNKLERQNYDDSDNWETRYMLLLWMSILVMNPFHFSRLDGASDINVNVPILPKMERIYRLCKSNCRGNDTCSTVAAFLSAKFLVRNEIKDIYLEQFFTWCFAEFGSDKVHIRYGTLAAIAAILKQGKREDLLQYAPKILKWILEQDFKMSQDFLKNKYYIKIVQRIGLILMAPKIAAWRYNRGSRSLQTNLTSNITNSIELLKSNIPIAAECDEDINVPEEIEEVIEELLYGLKSASSDVRWLAAKGIGRVTNRLPKSLGDEVVGSVIEILNPLEQHEAWHGACLAVAELAKRGLLLPYRLEHLVPLLLRALVYDEMKGYMSVGQNIRDSACYVCWAFARAYDPRDLQPFVQRIATGLLIVTVFDREINCRRAASAAFQESVGRLGTFPHGIDILTAADFYTVGLRNNSYLSISDYIAQYDEYTIPLLDHLVEMKTGHWDIAIRELAAKTLNKLTHNNPEHMKTNVLFKLFENTDSIDVNARHGSVLAIGEIILALVEINPVLIDELIMNKLNGLIIKFQTREQFRGMSGELMKMAALDLIKNCSQARVSIKQDCCDSWQTLIDSCIISKASRIREMGVSALSSLCQNYYKGADGNAEIRENYLKGSDNDLEEHVRMGYVLAIGALPDFMLLPVIEDVIGKLIELSLVPSEPSIRAAGLNPIIIGWSESRRDSVKAIGTVITSVGFERILPHSLRRIFECLLKALDEYTTDNRGDIGAWVREASMIVLHNFVTKCPAERLDADIIHSVMSGLAQQSVEKIDRTRGLAGKLFHNLVHHEPKIPHIKHHERLMEIFPTDGSKILWLFADHTFPLFCRMLELPEYSEKLLIGLSGSIGQLTESLIKYSSSSLLDFLKTHQVEIPRICDVILKIFRENLLNERITYPMLNFLEMILSSGVLVVILDDENSNFAEEIFRLVNLEIKGHKKLYKIVSSINVFCQLIQVSDL